MDKKRIETIGQFKQGFSQELFDKASKAFLKKNIFIPYNIKDDCLYVIVAVDSNLHEMDNLKLAYLCRSIAEIKVDTKVFAEIFELCFGSQYMSESEREKVAIENAETEKGVQEKTEQNETKRAETEEIEQEKVERKIANRPKKIKQMVILAVVIAAIFVTTVILHSNNSPKINSISILLLESLRNEQLSISESIKQANEEDNKLSGGLIKVLIGARLELLKINSALIQQRINAIESGAKIKIKLYEAKSDPDRAFNLKSEMDSIRSEIIAKEEEINRYSGGLIKVTLMSAVATMNNTLAMLQTEYLKAKYGIYWMSGSNKSEKITQDHESKKLVKPPKTQEDVLREGILVPNVTNKRYREHEYDKHIWFDVTWDTKNLKKKTRAVKGVLIFADLFGEPKFLVKKTINDPLFSNQSHIEDGIGFEYNQFKDSHKWMRSAELKDMTFQFKVESIIYSDGTMKEF